MPSMSERIGAQRREINEAAARKAAEAKEKAEQKEAKELKRKLERESDPNYLKMQEIAHSPEMRDLFYEVWSERKKPIKTDIKKTGVFKVKTIETPIFNQFDLDIELSWDSVIVSCKLGKDIYKDTFTVTIDLGKELYQVVDVIRFSISYKCVSSDPIEGETSYYTTHAFYSFEDLADHIAYLLATNRALDSDKKGMHV